MGWGIQTGPVKSFQQNKCVLFSKIWVWKGLLGHLDHYCLVQKQIGDQILHFGEAFEYCFGPGRWEFE